jgi:DHA2 family methylenomycin A resistance protein-like MFS transporter
MVNVALPAMAAALGEPPERLRWVIVCYVLAYAVLSFVGGALGDVAGHARVLRLGLAGSAVAFAATALAPGFGWLLAGRALQGISAGLVYGTTPALVTRGLPETLRPRALGFLNAAINLASTAGPALAGWLVDAAGWRAVFYARAPLALAVLLWTLGVRPAAPARLDAPRLRAADLRRAAVLAPAAMAFLAYAGIFAIWLLAPFYLVERRGLDTAAAGMLFTLTPLGMTAGAALAGRLAPAVGVRAAMACGLGLEALGLAAFCAAGSATPVPVLGAALLAAGLGLGVFQVPNMAAIMRQFGAGQQGAAGGLAFLARTLGVVMGVVVLAELFASARGQAGFDAGIAQAFAAAALAVAAAAVLGALRRA